MASDCGFNLPCVVECLCHRCAGFLQLWLPLPQLCLGCPAPTPRPAPTRHGSLVHTQPGPGFPSVFIISLQSTSWTQSFQLFCTVFWVCFDFLEGDARDVGYTFPLLRCNGCKRKVSFVKELSTFWNLSRTKPRKLKSCCMKKKKKNSFSYYS